MWIPNPLYRALPSLYAAAGAGLLAGFGFTGPAAVSALLLLAAALIVYEQRAHRRAALRRQRAMPLSSKLLPPR